MNSDALHQRGQALEDLFFKNRDQQLIEKMRADLAAQDARQALSHVTGIHDTAVLDALIKGRIAAESLTSVSLIPLVAVAWADGKMDAKERRAVLQAAEGAGIQPGQVAYELISSWLNEQPAAELLEAWKAYVHALKASLDHVALNQLKSKVLDRAEEVARATGGILGLGNKISQIEQDMLDELAEAFQ